jgi:hypothetical protein
MIILSPELLMILSEIDDEVSSAIMELDRNGNIENSHGVSKIDISDKDWMFEVTIGKRIGSVKVGSLVRDFFGNSLTQKQITEFTVDYNEIKNELFNFGKPEKKKLPPRTPLQVEAKKANYNNVRETFLSLVTETYPHGHEEEVMHLMPSDLEKDMYGNYYKIIGDSDVMFTSHLDTASYKKSKINLFTYKEGDDDIICTDNKTILGADDKAGVAVMLYMITHNVPGVYYFFMGEERGCIGSSSVVSNLDSFKFLKNIKKVVSFDRRNYNSVITVQMGGECCSNEFADALAAELNKNGMSMKKDPTGIFTDSACFMDDMPEITNISVGYFNEHQDSEIQNISFLERLAEASVKVDWASLPVRRRVGISPDLLSKFKGVISATKAYSFDAENPIKVIGDGDNVIIKIEVVEPSFDKFYKDIMALNKIVISNNVNSVVTFDENRMKINIKGK